ncbi:sterol esterase tgl1 [Anaeramoeba flamelloides]|uniref:Sterol esterase tgl1 n=1 Tax=Anaeramoeba flamelloides TaxID=1746091 RepID=A0ABQ8X294_9EUKA|nr:sterol esterase tgl1 [Anaeramoeba flamelloides]
MFGILNLIYELLRRSTVLYILFACFVFNLKFFFTLTTIPILTFTFIFEAYCSCYDLIKGAFCAVAFDALDQFKILCEPINKKYFKKTDRKNNLQKKKQKQKHTNFPLFGKVEQIVKTVFSYLPYLHNRSRIRTIEDLVIKKDYPLEHYTVETEDGHYLKLFRIPSSPKYENGTTTKKPVAFFMHGLLTCGTVFVVRKALALQLADQGYDVWLGNGRGGHYSQKHRKYDNQDDRFWSHTFDDTVHYDFPAMVDFVLNKTGQEKLNYFGFSQGSSQGFAAFSKFPGMNKKCNLFVALAPTAIVNKINTIPFKIVGIFPARFQRLIFGNKSFFEGIEAFFRKTLTPKLFALAIRAAIWFLFGFNTKNLEHKGFDKVCQTLYSPQSVNLPIQWFQQVKNEGFKYFDYENKKKNFNAYGQETPPEYDLSKITCPTVLVSGKADPIPDMKALFDYGLSSETVVRDIRIEGYEHMDILFGIGAQQMVYDPVIKLLNEYNFIDDN